MYIRQLTLHGWLCLLITAIGCQFNGEPDEPTPTAQAERSMVIPPMVTAPNNIHYANCKAEIQSTSVANTPQTADEGSATPQLLPQAEASRGLSVDGIFREQQDSLPTVVTLAGLNSPGENATQEKAEYGWIGFKQSLAETGMRPSSSPNDAGYNLWQTADSKENSDKSNAKQFVERLKIPSDLPGAEMPQLQLPPVDGKNTAPRQQALEKMFPPLPPVGDEFRAVAAQGRPLSLKDLEEMARLSSPTIRQAMADVRAAQGNAIQAGLYPNPTIGYESDNINTGQTAGYQGGFIDQQIKTGGKLQLSRASAMVDVDNAQVALQRAQFDLASSVRSNYFAVLAAEENVHISHSLVIFSDDIYSIQVDMVKEGQAAAYEPLQLRALAYQARANLLQARNRYASAWKQLAAALGLPGLPPTEIAGKIDTPVPIVPYESALTIVLANHTDVMTTQNTLRQAQINLRLAEANRIPDLTAHTAIQKDYTTPPFGATVNISVSAPLPLWDKNQGNIHASEAVLAKAMEGPHLTRSNLVARLADAYERYQSNLTLVDYYRTSILPDQVQSYRGTYTRHQEEPDVVGFSDIVGAQQSLTSAISSYVTALGALWQAVVDLGNLLQVNDIFTMDNPQLATQVPNLSELGSAPLRCLTNSIDSAQQFDRNWLPQPLSAKALEEVPMGPSILPP